MKSYEFKVLLYFDGSQQAFSAAVYTATLLKKLPNMHLTILQVQESDEGSIGTEYSWLELRPKYKRYYWGCSTGTEDNWIDSWLASPKSDWLKAVLDEPESDLKYQYYKILAKTNEIFSRKKFFVKQQVLCSNASISETMGIADTVDAIVDYSINNSFDLIIIGLSLIHI